jgi:hypothetical protein
MTPGQFRHRYGATDVSVPLSVKRAGWDSDSFAAQSLAYVAMALHWLTLGSGKLATISMRLSWPSSNVPNPASR